ncbi:MAG: hypothetical protein AAFR93_09905 [Pseudomonadota bacterium]
MTILLVQTNPDLGGVWCRFLQRRGLDVVLATTVAEAEEALATTEFSAMALDPLDTPGSLGLADIAAYRNPKIAIIAVTKSGFFTESDVFDLIPNARAVLRSPVRPDDLAAYLEHIQRREREGTPSSLADIA